MNDIDYVAVSRAAHQLAADHGPDAYLHAARLAKEAAAFGKDREAAFWQAVSDSLRPRAPT